MSDKEREFCAFMFGHRNGTFISAIYQAIMRASIDELNKLSTVYGEEVEIYRKYSVTPGYWDTVKSQYESEMLLKG